MSNYTDEEIDKAIERLLERGYILKDEEGYGLTDKGLTEVLKHWYGEVSE